MLLNVQVCGAPAVHCEPGDELPRLYLVALGHVGVPLDRAEDYAAPDRRHDFNAAGVARGPATVDELDHASDRREHRRAVPGGLAANLARPEVYARVAMRVRNTAGVEGPVSFIELDYRK